jgi:hypothetical protein
MLSYSRIIYTKLVVVIRNKIRTRNHILNKNIDSCLGKKQQKQEKRKCPVKGLCRKDIRVCFFVISSKTWKGKTKLYSAALWKTTWVKKHSVMSTPSSWLWNNTLHWLTSRSITRKKPNKFIAYKIREVSCYLHTQKQLQYIPAFISIVSIPIIYISVCPHNATLQA